MANYSFSGDDVLIDSDASLMTDFINLKIKSAQSFRCAYRDKMYTHVFIWMSAHTIYIKKSGKDEAGRVVSSTNRHHIPSSSLSFKKGEDKFCSVNFTSRWQNTFSSSDIIWILPRQATKKGSLTHVTPVSAWVPAPQPHHASWILALRLFSLLTNFLDYENFVLHFK
jgi:hypothetical protein